MKVKLTVGDYLWRARFYHRFAALSILPLVAAVIEKSTALSVFFGVVSFALACTSEFYTRKAERAMGERG